MREDAIGECAVAFSDFYGATKAGWAKGMENEGDATIRVTAA